jgi:hypothetical protein
LRPHQLPQGKLKVNGASVDWDLIEGLVSIGASLGGPGSKVLVAGTRVTADLVLAGSLISGAYPFYFDTSSPELASFACELMGFDSCVYCDLLSVDVVTGGKPANSSFFESLRKTDLSSIDWREMSHFSTIDLSAKPYLDAFGSVFSMVSLRGVNKCLVTEESNDQTRLMAESFKELGGNMVEVQSRSYLLGDFVYRDRYVWPLKEVNLWGQAISLALKLGGRLAVGIDAPTGLEEIMERKGGKLIRRGISEYDISSFGESFDVGVSSSGYWVIPALHRWKDAPAALVANTINFESDISFQSPYAVEVMRPVDISKLNWETSTGWGWRASAGNVDGSEVLVIERNGKVTVKVEDRDAAKARLVAEKVIAIIDGSSH